MNKQILTLALFLTSCGGGSESSTTTRKVSANIGAKVNEIVENIESKTKILLSPKAKTLIASNFSDVSDIKEKDVEFILAFILEQIKLGEKESVFENIPSNLSDEKKFKLMSLMMNTVFETMFKNITIEEWKNYTKNPEEKTLEKKMKNTDKEIKKEMKSEKFFQKYKNIIID